MKLEVRWKGDRRFKLWLDSEDHSDPVVCIGFQGTQSLPRNEIEFINVGDPKPVPLKEHWQ